MASKNKKQMLDKLDNMLESGLITSHGHTSFKEQIENGNMSDDARVLLMATSKQPKKLHLLPKRVPREIWQAESHSARCSPLGSRRPSSPGALSESREDMSGVRIAQLQLEEGKRKGSLDNLVDDGIYTTPKRYGHSTQQGNSNSTQGAHGSSALSQGHAHFPKVLPPKSPRAASESRNMLSDSEDDLSSEEEFADPGYALVGSRPSSHLPSVTSPTAAITAEAAATAQHMYPHVQEREQQQQGDQGRDVLEVIRGDIAVASSLRGTISKRRQSSPQMSPQLTRQASKGKMQPSAHIVQLQQLLQAKHQNLRPKKADYTVSESERRRKAVMQRSSSVQELLSRKGMSEGIASRAQPCNPYQVDFCPQRHEFVSVAQCLQWNAEHASDATALQLVEKNGVVGTSLTWALLSSRVRRVGEALFRTNSERGIVLLAFCTSSSKGYQHYIEAVLACIMCGMTAVPLLFSDSDASTCKWLHDIVSSLGVSQLCTDKESIKMLHVLKDLALPTTRIDSLPSDSKAKHIDVHMPLQGACAIMLPSHDASGNCRGLVITHSALMTHCSSMELCMGLLLHEHICFQACDQTDMMLWTLLASVFSCATFSLSLAQDFKASTALFKSKAAMSTRYSWVLSRHALQLLQTSLSSKDATGLPPITKAYFFLSGPLSSSDLTWVRKVFEASLTPRAIFTMTFSEMCGLVASGSLADIRVQSQRFVLQDALHGMLTPTSSKTDCLKLCGIGAPVPGATLYPLSMTDDSVCVTSELGELAMTSSHSLVIMFFRLPKPSAKHFRIPLALAGAGGQQVVARTGLVGAFLAPARQQPVALVSQFAYVCYTRRDMICVDRCFAAASDLKRCIALAAQLTNCVQKHGSATIEIEDIAVFQLPVAGSEQLVVVAEAQHLASMMNQPFKVDNWCEAICTELSLELDMQAYCCALAESGSLPRRQGVVDAAATRAAFMRHELRLLHVTLNSDVCIPQQQASTKKMIMTPIVEMAQASQTSSETAGPKLLLSEDVKAARTMISLLVKQNSRNPDRELWTICDYKGRETRLTVAGLLKRARRMAHHLEKKGVYTGERVVLFTYPSVQQVVAFHACLLLGAVPSIVSAPRSTQEFAQWIPVLQEVMRASSANKILLMDNTLKKLKKVNKNLVLRSGIVYLSLDSPGSREHYGVYVPRNRREIAYIDFNISPRGVITGIEITHQSMLTLGQSLTSQLELSSTRTVVTCMDTSSGVGHAVMHFLPLFCTNSIKFIVMDMMSTDDALSWLRTVSKFSADTAFCNYRALFAVLDDWMEQSTGTADMRQELDLTCLERCFVLTNERPWNALVSSFLSLFQASGLARTSVRHVLENTFNVFISSDDHQSEILHVDQRELSHGRLQLLEQGSPKGISIYPVGHACPAVKVAVVNSDANTLAPSSSIGELWVSSVYNAESFAGLDASKHAHAVTDLLQQSLQGHSSCYARTGLLGFVHNDVIYAVGAMQDSMLCNGQRHFPLDIENTIESAHPHLRLGTAAVWQLDSSSGIVAAIEVGDDVIYPAAMAPAIASAVVQKHQLALEAIIFLPRDSIPLEARGCKQRYLLRHLLSKGDMQPTMLVMNRRSAATNPSLMI